MRRRSQLRLWPFNDLRFFGTLWYISGVIFVHETKAKEREGGTRQEGGERVMSESTGGAGWVGGDDGGGGERGDA